MKKVIGYIEIKQLPRPAGYAKDFKIMFRGTCNEVVNKLFNSRKEAVEWLSVNEPQWVR